VRLLVREGIVLVTSVAVLDFVLVALASRGLGRLLFGVTSVDPIAFLGAPVLLIAIGALAAFPPVQPASRADPASALRGGMSRYLQAVRLDHRITIRNRFSDRGFRPQRTI
jgi:putative ABC transport system permease protein